MSLCTPVFFEISTESHKDNTDVPFVFVSQYLALLQLVYILVYLCDLFL